MPDEQPDLTARAEALMQEQRFAEAIEAFDTHLERTPADPRALLQLGICHLLDRSEEIFLDIYQRAARLLGALEQVPAELARLWRLYRSLVAKVTATALVTSTVGLTACDKTDALPDPSVAPPSTSSMGATETGEPTAEATGEVTATGEPAPSTSATSTATAAATATATPPPPATTTTPAHRYSGGVRPNPTPAHRYSAGVRRSPGPDGAS
ncbi:MAG: tetratricopeptide repeat protein [Deltaproteobacteria bacterium]|nr:tetratricopeptide repeat protein [Deltaproteobacteria bacterium]